MRKYNEIFGYPEREVTKCGVPSVQHQTVATRSKNLKRSTSLLADSKRLCAELITHQYWFCCNTAGIKSYGDSNFPTPTAAKKL